jgi:ketosteroid isomerase-like protein
MGTKKAPASKAASKKAPAKKAVARKSVGVADLIKANNKALGAALAAGDAKAIGKMYTKNGRVLPQNLPLAKGTKAVTAFWQGAIDGGIRGAALKSAEVEQFGTTAVEVGSYTLSAADGAVLDKGKYIVVWKKDAGQWKLHQDIFNSDGAPAA